LTLHRFKASYNYKVSEVHDAIFPTSTPLDTLQVEAPKVTAVNEEGLAKEVKEAPSIACPKCSSDLVIRTAKKGDNKGSAFLACSAFPKCRYTLYNTDLIEPS